MTKQFIYRGILIIAVLSVPWIYLGSIWNSLPEIIPVHFGRDGTPDEFGPKSKVFFAPVLFTGMSLVLFLLMTNVHKLDPKRFAGKQPAVFFKIAMAIVVFLCAVSLFVLHWTVKRETAGLNIFFIMMGLLFAFLGNLMHSIKPNYFAGFRVPWTLESERNWKATHQLAGKVWFGGGILMAVFAIFIDPFIMIFVMVGLALIMLLIPGIFSYRFFKKENLSKS